MADSNSPDVGISPFLQQALPALGLNYVPTGRTTPQVGIDVPYRTSPSGGNVAPAPVFRDQLGRSFSSAGVANASNARINQIRTAREGIEAGGRVSVNTLENTYNDNVRNFLRGLEQSENTINQGRATNALNLRRSTQNIISGVRQGLRSGAVSLGNMNALDSGAAEALSRAYSRVGQQQTGEARGQAALRGQELDTQQKLLDKEREDKLLAFNQFRNVEADRISQDLYNKLATLQAEAQAQNVPANQVNLGARDAIIADAFRRLAIIDQMRDQRLAGIRAYTPDEVMREAIRMENEGLVGDTPFSVENPEVIAPGGGPPLSQLPLFGRRTDEQSSFLVPRTDEDNRLAIVPTT